MSNYPFSYSPAFGQEVAPSEVVGLFEAKPFFHAAIHQQEGISADTFVEFSSRLAHLCLQAYGENDVTLTLDTAHPTITIECEEVDEQLAAQPGESLTVPADPSIFELAFMKARAADVIIKPKQEIPGMLSTFARASWDRSAPRLMEFYAQGGSKADGFDFIEQLYHRMFYVPESAPRPGIDVALGILAVHELRRYSMGSAAHMNEKRANFDAISSQLGLQTSDYYLGSPHHKPGLFERFKRHR